MEGGIQAWKGLVAIGIPEAGMAYFEPAKKAEELIALAWLLEDGSNEFYWEMARKRQNQPGGTLFQDLSADEEEHKSSLFKIYRKVSGKESDPKFPQSLISIEPGEKYLEGGMLLDKALEWIKEKDLRETLELSISLEVNAIDLYIKMERKVAEKAAQQVFQTLSNQERSHLKRLSAFLEKS